MFTLDATGSFPTQMRFNLLNLVAPSQFVMLTLNLRTAQICTVQ